MVMELGWEIERLNWFVKKSGFVVKKIPLILGFFEEEDRVYKDSRERKRKGAGTRFEIQEDSLDKSF